MVVRRRLFAILCVMSAACGFTRAQSNCTLEVPASVVGPGGLLARGLEASSFVAQSGKKTIPITELGYDRAARRIALVVDRGRHMNEAATTIASGIVERILQNARQGDSFALIVVGRKGIHQPFTDASKALERFRNAPAAEDEAEKPKGILDAVSEAADWFQPAQPGDSIYVLTGDDEFKNSRANFHRLYDLLLERRIRVFGLLFNYIFRGTYYGFMNSTSAGPGVTSTQSSFNFSPDEEDMNSLTWGTGGYLSVENTHNQLHEYKLTDQRLQEMKELGWQAYGAMAEFYRLQISPGSSGKPRALSLDLAPPLREKASSVTVLYPRRLPACSAAP